MINVNVTIPKRRSIFLTLILYYIGVSLISRGFNILFPSAYPEVYAGAPSWLYTYQVGALVIGIIGLIAAFKWRIWGADILAYIILTDMLINLFAFEQSAPVKFSLSSVIFLILYSIAVYRDIDKFIPYPYLQKLVHIMPFLRHFFPKKWIYESNAV